MNTARKACLGLIIGGIFSTLGCCYHSRNFGSTHDIGIGKCGCGTCKSCNNCVPCNWKTAGPAQEGGNCAACNSCGNGTISISHQDFNPPRPWSDVFGR